MRGLAIDTAAWASPWRYRSPGDKVLLSGGLLGAALVLPPWPGGVAVAMLSVGLTLGPARVPWRVLLVAARGVLAFVLLGALGLAVVSSPAGGFPLTVTSASLAAAAAAAGHALAGTAALFLLAATTPISDLLAWLRRRGLPEVVVDLAGLIYRLLFVLLATTGRIRAAQRARLGYATRRATLRSAAMLTAAVLTRAWERARRLEDGLAGRGLAGAIRVLDPARPSSGRFVAASLTAVSVVVLGTLAADLWTGTPWH